MTLILYLIIFLEKKDWKIQGLIYSRCETTLCGLSIFAKMTDNALSRPSTCTELFTLQDTNGTLEEGRMPLDAISLFLQ